MKYWHGDIEPILNFIESNNLCVWHCERDGIVEQSSPSAIKKMMDDSQELWGGAAFYYMLIGSPSPARGVSLTSVLSKIESGQQGHFALIAYQDGGLISVSSRELSFQSGAKSASWWHD